MLFKIIEGLKISSAKMLEEKKKNNQNIVISENGEIKIINARDIKE